MKQLQIIAMVLLVFMFMAGLIANIAVAQQNEYQVAKLTNVPAAKHVQEEILVKFKPGVNAADIAKINRRHGASVLATSRFTATKRLRVPPGKTIAETVKLYSHNPNVLYAEPNFLVHIASSEPYYNDPFYPYQWHLDNIDYGGIGMEEAWSLEPGGNSNVIVAIIDTGVAYEDNMDYAIIGKSGKRKVVATYAQAPDLYYTNFVSGYDFVNKDEHPNDDDGHGTHVTGTIAQSTNNGIGVAGIAYNTSIMPVKVLDDTGSGTYFDVAEGIYFASENGARIISLSLGGSSPSETMEQALIAAHENNVTIICASGNDGSPTTIIYPAAYDEYCIAVGATRYDEAVAPYSNRGESLDLTAPGGDTAVDQNGDGYADGVLQQTFIDSDYTSFGYYFFQGTSMATPHVTGVAALLMSRDISLTPDQVREVLQATAEDHGAEGWDPDYGWGIVDAAAALSYSSEDNLPPVANPGGPYSGREDNVLIFDGSGSIDPDNDSMTYLWDFGDGFGGAGVSPEHVYSAGGMYTITLTVHDGRVSSQPVTTTADIVEVNDPPVADAGLDQSANMDEVLLFDGSASYDEEGYDLSYLWDFGDGSPTSNERIASHAYSVAGSYTVILIVSDGGYNDMDSAIVDISETSTLLIHVESIDMSLKFAGVNTSALVDITIFDTVGSPVSGITVKGAWSGATSDVDSGLTDLNGRVILESDKLKNATAGTIFTFTVTGYGDVTDGESSASITVP